LNIETLLQIDAKTWPLAAMMFFRILTCLIFLPIFSDNSVNLRIRIVFSMALAFLLWPALSPELQKFPPIDATPLGLLICTMREVFFGFAIGTCGKVLNNAANVGSHLVGVGMGFQTASMLNPQTGAMEDAYTTLKTWIVVLLMLTFQVHHIFLEEIVASFRTVPFSSVASTEALLNTVISSIQSSFSIGIRMGAPILIAQVLVTFAIGLINRAIPQLNAMVIQFPVSFMVSMVVLFFSIAGTIQLLGTQGLFSEKQSVAHGVRSFVPQGILKSNNQERR
jgi:flagellar biosynthesis protein FliR